MWDVFISHASEDKEAFVAPMAKKMSESGVKVWYDEFELSLGDSLIENIDRGLRESKYGIIVLSNAFFEKHWTMTELNTLLNRMVHKEAIIIPILYGITIEQLKERNSILADIMSLNGNQPIDKVVWSVIKRIRPDILNDLALKNAAMKVRRHIRKGDYERKETPISRLVCSEERYHCLPIEIVLSTLLISGIFNGIEETNMKDMLSDFKRDLDYQKEFLCWSIISYVYLLYLNESGTPLNDINIKRDVFKCLISFTLDPNLRYDSEQYQYITEKEYIALIRCFIKNIEVYGEIIEKYTNV